MLFTRIETTERTSLKAHTELFEGLLRRVIESAQPLLNDGFSERLNALVVGGLRDEYSKIVATIRQTITAQDEILSTVGTVQPLGVHPSNLAQLCKVRRLLVELIETTE